MIATYNNGWLINNESIKVVLLFCFGSTVILEGDAKAPQRVRSHHSSLSLSDQTDQRIYTIHGSSRSG
jgi:hypothetical protein